MEIKHKKEITDAKRKRSRDQFYIVLMGLIGYGLVLIAIVIGTFFAIRNTFNKKDAEVAAAVTAAGSGSGSEAEAMDVTMNDKTDTASVAESADNVTETVSDPGAGIPQEHGADPSEYMTEDGSIDYSVELFKPGKRDASLKWSDQVFSKIENVKQPAAARVNSYDLKRRYSSLANGGQLELCIYSDPSTRKVEKITAVEYGSGPMGIIDYYYNDGVVNYIAERAADIDEPVDISSGKITSRYYFAYDTMVKYSYCEDNKATVFNAASLKDYSEGTVGQYEYLEAKMLNKAYITLNAADSLPDMQLIEGYILDEYEQPLSDVQIQIIDEADNSEVTSGMTDGDGHYRLSMPADDNGSYMLTARKDALDGVNIYGITACEGSGTIFPPVPRLTYSDDGAEYNLQVVVRDSIDNLAPITDASIRLRSGLNCREGDVIASSVLDATGAAMFTLQSGNYTAEVSKGGYEDSFFNVIVTVNRPATVGYAVKDIPDGEIQIVLAWDMTPLDLDARLISSGAVNVIRGHQDSVGSLSTETISLNTGAETEAEDVYRYYVSDYSDCIGGDANSGNMTSSGARVYIYSNEGITATFDVPLGHLGVVWEPFDIRKGKVIPVNHYYNAIEADSYWTAK